MERDIYCLKRQCKGVRDIYTKRVRAGASEKGRDIIFVGSQIGRERERCK